MKHPAGQIPLEEEVKTKHIIKYVKKAARQIRRKYYFFSTVTSNLIEHSQVIHHNDQINPPPMFLFYVGQMKNIDSNVV